MKRAQGFTLIELLVVFAILGVIIGIIPPAMGKLRDAVDYRQTVQDVTALLRKARQQATLQGSPWLSLSIRIAANMALPGRPRPGCRTA